jgi:hypothetical protein
MIAPVSRTAARVLALHGLLFLGVAVVDSFTHRPASGADSAVTISAAQIPVNLRTAGSYTILSKAGVTTTGTTKITGNMAVSPIASTAMTGFGLILDPSGQFSKSARVTGKIYAANYAVPTPSKLTTAILDMQTAYNDAAARKYPNFLNLGSGNIGGKILRPGLYRWSSGVTVPSNVTISGSSTAVWVFQIAGTLNMSSGKQMLLSGGALRKNIFWQVAGHSTLGTTSIFQGILLGKTGISMKTGARFNGRALAQTAVTLDANVVNLP